VASNGMSPFFYKSHQDHLDFHGTMDNYFEPKRALYSTRNSEKKAQTFCIVNIDDRYGRDSWIKSTTRGVVTMDSGRARIFALNYRASSAAC